MSATVHDELRAAQAELDRAVKARQDRLNQERIEELTIQKAQQRVDELARQQTRERLDAGKAEMSEFVARNRSAYQDAFRALDALGDTLRAALPDAIGALDHVRQSWDEHHNHALRLDDIAYEYLDMKHRQEAAANGNGQHQGEGSIKGFINDRQQVGQLVGNLPAAYSANDAIAQWIIAAKDANERHTRQAIGWLMVLGVYNQLLPNVPNPSDELALPTQWQRPRPMGI